MFVPILRLWMRPLVWAALLLIFVLPAHAQPGRHGHHHEGAMPRDTAARRAMHKELRAYREQNVLPVMQQLRARLETSIEAADKEAIARYRQLMADKKETMKALREQQMSQQAMREQHQQWRAAHETELEGLKALTEKYAPEIEALMAEIAPQRQQWEADHKAIVNKYRPTEAPQHPPRPEGAAGPQEGRKGRRDGHKREGFHMRWFLLLPAEAETAAPVSPRALSGAQVAPNPAGQQATLRFALSAAQTVRITLQDESGMAARTLPPTEYAAGSHSVNLDLAGLKPGVYYCLISEANGAQQTVKIVVAPQ